MTARSGKRKRPLVVLGLLAGSTLVAFFVGELLVRRAPGLLPSWYRERQPLHGVELFHPGILAATPVDSLPLPIVAEAHDGPVPSDLKELGLVPADYDGDERDFPRLVAPVDALGLPNPTRPERADVVLVGDSFVVATGASQPLGLRGQLAEASGLDVYVCAYAGIGPVRELSLFERAGLPLEPAAVIWFFFGGNDVIDAMAPEYYRRIGCETYADVYADRRPPRSLLLDLVASLVRGTDADAGTGAKPAREPLPPFALPAPSGASTDVWFHPGQLAQLLWTRAEWEASPGWRTSTDALRRAHALCSERGIRLLVVYLPTKAEVYLPYIEPDAELLHRTVSFPLPEPHALLPEDLRAALLARRHALDEAVEGFCAAEGLDFLSATPLLEALAARGDPPYLIADSHWHPGGQRALVDPLVAWLRP